jgi:Prolyl oligopeptidase family
VSAFVRSLVWAPALLVIAQGGWEANPRLVQLETARQKGVFNYEESRVGSVELPDPLTTAMGPVRDPKSWAARRTEIRDLFREHVYGSSPGKPDKLTFEVLERNERAMDGASTLERIAIVSSRQDRTHRFELTVFLPNAPASGAAPPRVPVLMLLNNRPATNTDPTRKEKSGFWPAEQVIARGFGIAALQVGELAPDDKDRFRDGVIRLFEGTTEGTRPGNAWAALAAWGWGASRAMDYFATHPRIDAARVGVVGHSRGGKAALWAGAEDERFALVISNESGEGGAALTRRNFGETLARITESFPHWFAGNYRSYAERIPSLPVDQHMLLSLIAPRALYVASADEDLWSDPRGEFLSLAHSSPVFAVWGDRAIEPGAMPALERPMISGRRGYHIRRGPHNLTPYDWDRFVDFAGTLWK